MKPEGFIHSKMPGIKYRTLLHLPLSCGYCPYFEGDIKKRRCPHSLFTYVTLPKGRRNSKTQLFKESKLPAGASQRPMSNHATHCLIASPWSDRTSWFARTVQAYVCCPIINVNYQQLNNCPPYSQVCLSLDNKLYSDHLYGFFCFLNVVNMALFSPEQIQLKLKDLTTSFDWGRSMVNTRIHYLLLQGYPRPTVHLAESL